MKLATNFPIDRPRYIICSHVMSKAIFYYFTYFISANSENSRQVSTPNNTTLHRDKSQVLPDSFSLILYAVRFDFVLYFTDNTAHNRSSTIFIMILLNNRCFTQHCFTPTTTSEVRTIIIMCPDKSCGLILFKHFD